MSRIIDDYHQLLGMLKVHDKYKNDEIVSVSSCFTSWHFLVFVLGKIIFRYGAGLGEVGDCFSRRHRKEQINVWRNKYITNTSEAHSYIAVNCG